MVQQYSDCDFESLLAKYDYNFKRGDIVNGVVCDYESNGAIVDIGSKSAAFVPSYEVSSDKNAKVEIHFNPAFRKGTYALFQHLRQGQRNKYAGRKG